MGNRMTTVVFRPDRKIMIKRLPMEMGALLDHKERRAVMARRPCVGRMMGRPRMLPWVKITPIVGWWYGDGDPLDFEAAQRDWRNDTVKVTKEERRQLTEEASFMALMRGTSKPASNSIWWPISVVAALSVLLVLVFMSVAYLRGDDSGATVPPGGEQSEVRY